MKKKIIIIVLTVLALGILGFAGYKTADYINQKNAEKQAIREMEIELNYLMQNNAFYDDLSLGEYMPYYKEYEWRMQIRINFYTQETGKPITLSDIETFLAIKENPDGSPRTWVDDETGIIKDYVDWCNRGNNLMAMHHYRSELNNILFQYVKQHRECPYYGLNHLTPKHINELSKKYEDPDYELVLE